MATKDTNPEFIKTDLIQAHWIRKKQILKDHPELKQYMSKGYPLSAVYTTMLVALMITSAYLLQDASWWVVILIAYVGGSFPSHALWVMIHDLTHDLVFKSKSLNRFFLCFANMAHTLPSAVVFSEKHKQHHTYMGETYDDPDLAVPLEADIFGHTMLGKAMWLLIFPISMTFRQALEPLYTFAPPSARAFRLTIIHFWIVLNWVLVLGTDIAIYYYWGPKALAFLIISLVAGLGFHPLGGRWLAEHFTVVPTQETFSYYGSLNYVIFNVGYHNEHHDFPTISWCHLPDITSAAPEYYTKTLHYHTSYVRLLWDFLFNPKFTLNTRMIRESHHVTNERKKE